MIFRQVLRKFSEIQTAKKIILPKSFEEYHVRKTELTKSQKIWEHTKNEVNPEIPHDPVISLRENFLYDFKKEDFDQSNELVKKSMSLANATARQLLSFKKQSAMKKFQRDLLDTGSPAVQVACMTERLVHMINHCLVNNKDYKTKRKIHELFHRRRTMLNYLMKSDPNYYVWVIKEYNIQESQKILQSFKLIDKKHKPGYVINKKDYSADTGVKKNTLKHLRSESKQRRVTTPTY